MTDKELRKKLQEVAAELNKRQKLVPALAPTTDLCADLQATSSAVQQALIDNGCLPL